METKIPSYKILIIKKRFTNYIDSQFDGSGLQKENPCKTNDQLKEFFKKINFVL